MPGPGLFDGGGGYGGVQPFDPANIPSQALLQAYRSGAYNLEDAVPLVSGPVTSPPWTAPPLGVIPPSGVQGLTASTPGGGAASSPWGWIVLVIALVVLIGK